MRLLRQTLHSGEDLPTTSATTVPRGAVRDLRRRWGAMLTTARSAPCWRRIGRVPKIVNLGGAKRDLFYERKSGFAKNPYS